MIRITVGYPSAKDEIAILKHENMVAASEVEAIVSAKELMEMRKEAAAVHVEDSIYGYMVNIANASRTHCAPRHDGAFFHVQGARADGRKRLRHS
mgnify:CR=1 FL=1